MVKTTNIDRRGKTRKMRKLVYGPGNDCAFPFKFKGKLYDHECVKDEIGDWCATSKTKNNYFKNWGYCDNKVNKSISPKKRILKKKILKKSSSRNEVSNDELKHIPVDINTCKYTKSMLDEEEHLKDIDKKKLIKVSNGNCYNIDELVQYLISQEGKNVDPINLLSGVVTPLWVNEEELLQIKNFSGIDPIQQTNFNSIMDKTLSILKMPPYVRLLNTPKGQEFMDKLIITGKICTEDYTSSYKPSQIELSRTRDFISDNFTKEEQNMLKEISSDNGLKLENVLLKNTGIVCIHAIGFRLISLYFSAFIKVRNIYKTFKESPKLSLHQGIVEISSDIFIFCHGTKGSKYKSGPKYPLSCMMFNTQQISHIGKQNGGTGRLFGINEAGKVEKDLGSNKWFSDKYVFSQRHNLTKYLDILTSTNPMNILNQFADRPGIKIKKNKLTTIKKCKNKKKVISKSHSSK
jgi:hypothetical protein